MSAPCSRQITTPAPHHSVLLQAGCPSCHPTNSVKALKAVTVFLANNLASSDHINSTTDKAGQCSASERQLTTWHCPHSAATHNCYGMAAAECQLCSNQSKSPAGWAHSSKPAAAAAR